MQPSVSVAQQLPTAASSMPLASTTPVVAGKLPSATTAFGDALGKLLATVAAANQPAAPTDAATAIAQATADPPASVPTLQPGQTPSAPLALPPPETAIRAPSDTGTSKASPETLPARRGTFPRVTRASMPVDQQALPTDVLAVPTPLPDNAPEHVAPAAPRHHAEALEQKEVAVSSRPAAADRCSASRADVGLDAIAATAGCASRHIRTIRCAAGRRTDAAAARGFAGDSGSVDAIESRRREVTVAHRIARQAIRAGGALAATAEDSDWRATRRRDAEGAAR